MIEKLIPEQEAKLPVIRNKWLQLGLSTDPVDQTKAEDAIKLAYKCAGLTAPEKILWYRSPLEGALAVKELLGVDEESSDVVFSAIHGSQDAGWLSFYDFFREIGVELPILDGLIALAKTCGWCWPFSELIVMTERPTKIVRDDQNRPHCENGMAIQYSDGFGVYCWHGVRVNEQIIMHPERINPKDVLGADNQEVRRIMLERCGWVKLLKDLGAEKVHEDATGVLYSTKWLREYLDGEDAEARFVEVTDPSTGRKYCLRVPPTTNTAKEGVAWTFGMSENSYAPLKET
jgi:hypothetical protein